MLIENKRESKKLKRLDYSVSEKDQFMNVLPDNIK